jgi:hypothetical protein
MTGQATNRAQIISTEGGKILTAPELQVHPCEGFNIHQTEEGLIDPSIVGWEEKLENALWQTVIKNSPDPKRTAEILNKPDPPQRS